MPVRGNFDDIIRQALGYTMYEKLKEDEWQMTAPPRNRPTVMMEKGKREFDYPHTRTHDYIPYSDKGSGILQHMLKGMDDPSTLRHPDERAAAHKRKYPQDT